MLKVTETEFDGYTDRYKDHILFDFLIRKKGDIILKNTKNLIRGLECGCGPGQYVDYLNKNGKQVCGIDISKNMIKQAKKESFGEFYCMDVLNMNFKDKSFDFCYCINLLHHLNELSLIKRTISELRRVSKKVIIIELVHNTFLTKLYQKFFFKLSMGFDKNSLFLSPSQLENLTKTKVRKFFFNTQMLAITE